jgi:hypothetical protein
MTYRCRPAIYLAATALAIGVLGGCAAHATKTEPAQTSSRSPADVVAIPRSSSTITRQLPPAPWRPPPAAVAVARRYVIAALSYSWTEPPDAWTVTVASICTPQWDRALRMNADGGSGGRSAIVAGHDHAGTRILNIYPSAGPGPGRRLDITAQVTLTSSSKQSVTGAVLSVDLLPQPDGSWLIGWAG